MELTYVSVKNFKGLRDIEIPVSRFVCVIGENNSGKSSLLQALLLFVEGRKIEPSMYFDFNSPVTISIRFDSVSDADLSLITNEEHRNRFSEILTDRSITLVRRYETNGASRLRWIARVPRDTRFKQQLIDALLQGKKPGAAFADELKKIFPEITNQVDSKTNQKEARALIEQTARAIPDSQKYNQETDLPAGFDNTIRPLLPEPIYIPAVKDLADEIATKESASFGRLLGILLSQIAPQLENAEETFRVLKTSLNRIPQPDGSILDSRLEAVRNIETLVQSHVRENFPLVELDIRVPPPEIKAVLSGAQIWVDDGTMGMIETKGDGLKRTVTFSILRSFVELRRMEKPSGLASETPTNYLFLFEEPELYLHPTAQKSLFDALTEISKTNHVLVSTHSPLFFGAEATGTFIKLAKRSDPTVAAKPFAEAVFVDLSDLDNKSRFQIISYETNNTAFFSDTVVLVEGDSELLIMPHVARTLNPDWDPERTGVAFCRIGGKGNVSRYRDFFSAFKVRVCVIADLDCLLEGFAHLNASEGCVAVRQELLHAADAIVQAENIQGKLSSRDIAEIQRSGVRHEQFRVLKETWARFKEGNASFQELTAAEEQFFAELLNNKRRRVLEESSRPEIVTRKRELLRLLRGQDIYVFERGAIEDYYPESVTGPDKPSRTMDFCRRVANKEELLALCGDTICSDGVSQDKEFNVIFSQVFRER